MHKDSLKIIKDNWFLGTGGRGWFYNYKNIQSYNYTTSEVHSYFLQLMIENGVICGIIWIIMIVYAILQILKRIKTNEFRAIDFAFILLTMHSFADFDMSFYVILFIWYILYSIVIQEKNNEKSLNIKNKTINKSIIMLLFIMIQFGGILAGAKCLYVKNEDEYHNQNKINLLESDKKYNIIEQVKNR